MSESNKIGFLDYFSNLEDPRINRKKLYPIEEILLITLAGVICGCEGWTDLEEFGKTKLEFFRKYLQFENGVPSDDTYRRFYRAINPNQFKKCFIEWVKSFQEINSDVVAIDGKTLRHSYDRAKDKPAIHMISAFASNARIVLGQEKVSNKSNEITAIPKLLELLDIKGATVTIDAMGCQKKIAKKVIDKEADYVFGLKGNQGTLKTDVELFFEHHRKKGFKKLKHDYCCTVDKDHGRLETRECWITKDIGWLEGSKQWEGLNSVIMIESTREIGEKISRETRYYISSLSVSAETISNAIREHWGVENGLHWVLDVTFREDDSRIRKGNAPENLAIIRHAVINMLQPHRNKNISIKRLRKKVGWDTNTLEMILATKF
jgi:predicted transposase YbfD/YdcC